MMKKIVGAIVSLIGFFAGIYVLYCADSTMSFRDALPIGLALCIFFGINAIIWIHGDKHK